MANQKLAWSFNAGSPAGSVDTSGQTDSDAVTLAAVSVDPASNKALAIQLSNIDKLAFFAVTSSLYGEKVKVKADGAGAAEIKLSGPLVLFGGAIALLGPSLATLTVTNDDNATAANVQILIGSNLT